MISGTIEIVGVGRRTLAEVNASWINRHVNQMQADGYAPCVVVALIGDEVDLSLATNACKGRAVHRTFTPTERAILQLWKKNRLNQDDFKGGHVVAFLQQLRRRFASGMYV